MKKDFEVTHYGPPRWEGPAEKKHYSRHSTLEQANTHARKLAHASLPKEKGWTVDHWNNDEDELHSYHHVHDSHKKLGDSVFAQRVGSQQKFEKDVESGRQELDPGIMEPLAKFAFKKDLN